MRITKTTNPLAAIELMPLYVELPDCSREQLAENLFIQLSEKPNETLVLALINDDNKQVGMVVAYIRAEESDVRIWQLSVLPGIDRKWADIMVGMVQGWAKGMGYPTITGEPVKHPGVYARRWGVKCSQDGLVSLETANG